jgi:uncharacterized protein YdeI (YjbR/CyaY-like superfamily)
VSARPKFFATPAAFRRWLGRHHASETALIVGFYKKGSGRPSMTWPEAVDQALCFGWIDGVRRSIDAESYTNRFTPRRPRSNWSDVNVKRVQELMAAGLMQPAGLEAFNRRDHASDREYNSNYAYGRDSAALTGEYERRLKANRKAWRFYQAQPPSYRRVAAWWVISAKKEETRMRRLQQLIDDSAAGRRVGPMRRAGET